MRIRVIQQRGLATLLLNTLFFLVVHRFYRILEVLARATVLGRTGRVSAHVATFGVEGVDI